MGDLVVLFDFLAVAAVIYILYRKFVAPSPKKAQSREIAYEEGFNDAIRYFGLKKLYEDDPELKQRMNEVFSEAGVSHKYLDASERKNKSNKRPDRLSKA